MLRLVENAARKFGPQHWPRLNLAPIACVIICCAVGANAAADPVNITTYHGNVLRNGWNARETVLKPTTVKSAAFGLVKSVNLDAQIDAQPLYVSGQSIASLGTHNVVYVATENNSVYAIDGDTGNILLNRSLGAPVPIAALPGQCADNSDMVGITATPVIDVASQTLYILAYTFENNAPVYRIHALALATLMDKISPAAVSSIGTLNPTNSKYAFDPSVARARAALLLSKGNVYAAFSSFCDQKANVARGWIVGWRASSLAPFSTGALLQRQSTNQTNFFLNSVWMSGYGIAADGFGRLFFVTGNSDPSGTAFQPPFNLAESVVKLTPDLSTVVSYFTPAGVGVDYATLEASDLDFGSGGVMLIPRQPGNYPRLAVAAGKVGIMYLMNADSLGGHNLGNGKPDNVIGQYQIGACYCGESYFRGADGVGRVVSSGGSSIITWKLNTTGATPRLGVESRSVPISNGENAGFFTTISSNGLQAKSQIIWAIGRPVDNAPGTINLQAFDPSHISASGRMVLLFSGAAGTWPKNGHANLVPLVANGRVFVGSYKQLSIFGISKSLPALVDTASSRPATADVVTEPALPGHSIYGVLIAKANGLLKLRTRTGAVITIDSRDATKAYQSVVPVLGGALLARGEYDHEGIFHARSILRAKDLPTLWGKDR